MLRLVGMLTETTNTKKTLTKTNTMKTKKCEMCGYENHIDNFKCEGYDCGIPLDLTIEINSFGLPEITQKEL